MSVHAYQMRGGVGDFRPEPTIHAAEYAEGKVAEGKGWTCYAREVKHAQPYIECYGFRFETEEGVVAFSGDTAPIESVVELARDADLFVMEAVHREEKIQTFPSVISETGTLNAGRMAAEAGAKRLVINHQSPTLDPAEETTQGIAEGKKRLRRTDVLGAGHDGSGLVIGSASWRPSASSASTRPCTQPASWSNRCTPSSASHPNTSRKRTRRNSFAG